MSDRESRELSEEPEVAGMLGSSSECCGEEYEEHYQVSGDITLSRNPDELGRVARGLLRHRQHKRWKQDGQYRISGVSIDDVEVEGDEVLGMAYTDGVGFSFKKLVKKATGAAKKATRYVKKNPLTVLAPGAQLTLAALKKTGGDKLIKKGFRYVKKNPLTVIAPGIVPTLKLLNLARKKVPSALAKLMAVKAEAEAGNEEAQEAVENLETANEVQYQAQADTGDSHAYDPPEAEPTSEDLAPGDAEPDEQTYEPEDEADGEGEGEGEEETVEVLGFSFKKFVKKATGAAKVFDITNKNNPLRAVIPPNILSAADLAARAANGAKDAQRKLADLASQAASGNDLAKQAQANVEKAQELLKLKPWYQRLWEAIFPPKK